MREVRIYADSTCDLSRELLDEYQIGIIPLSIILGEKSYYDLEEIVPEEIFQWADSTGGFPMTSAPDPEKILGCMKEDMDADRDIIFLGISAKLSTTCNVVQLAAGQEGYERIFVIDSQSLSTGTGLLVLRAAQLAREGMAAEQIVREIKAARAKVCASFVVDSLTYLARGGRCSSVTAMMATTLRIKPRITVKNGELGVDKKFRGEIGKVILKYVKAMEEDLKKACPQRVFITHSGCEEAVVLQVRKYLRSLNYFENIYVTTAGSVVSSHCGRSTLGVMFEA